MALPSFLLFFNVTVPQQQIEILDSPKRFLPSPQSAVGLGWHTPSRHLTPAFEQWLGLTCSAQVHRQWAEKLTLIDSILMQGFRNVNILPPLTFWSPDIHSHPLRN